MKRHPICLAEKCGVGVTQFHCQQYWLCQLLSMLSSVKRYRAVYWSLSPLRICCKSFTMHRTYAYSMNQRQFGGGRVELPPPIQSKALGVIVSIIKDVDYRCSQIYYADRSFVDSTQIDSYLTKPICISNLRSLQDPEYNKYNKVKQLQVVGKQTSMSLTRIIIQFEKENKNGGRKKGKNTLTPKEPAKHKRPKHISLRKGFQIVKTHDFQTNALNWATLAPCGGKML